MESIVLLKNCRETRGTLVFFGWQSPRDVERAYERFMAPLLPVVRALSIFKLLPDVLLATSNRKLHESLTFCILMAIFGGFCSGLFNI